MRAARAEARATYLLTGLDGELRHLTATEADALGQRAALAVAQGRPTVIGEVVLEPILPPLHLVVYLGILGPRDRTDRLLAELPSPPSEDDLAVLHAPAGLDLGADGAEQVTSSIMAEILAVLHGRSGGHLRDHTGPIRG